MNQTQLDKLKMVAHQTGSWAEYLLSETEYWAPKDLDNLTPELLEQTEQESREWLAENREFYPAGGATEDLRASLTEQAKDSQNLLTEEQAYEAEMMRLDGDPIEEILKRLKRRKRK